MLILSLFDMLYFKSGTEGIQDLIAVLLVLIPLGAAVRATWILSSMTHAEDGELPGLKRQLKNLLVFVVIAETAAGVISLLSGYFRGG